MKAKEDVVSDNTKGLVNRHDRDISAMTRRINDLEGMVSALLGRVTRLEGPLDDGKGIETAEDELPMNEDAS